MWSDLDILDGLKNTAHEQEDRLIETKSRRPVCLEITVELVDDRLQIWPTLRCLCELYLRAPERPVVSEIHEDRDRVGLLQIGVNQLLNVITDWINMNALVLHCGQLLGVDSHLDEANLLKACKGDIEETCFCGQDFARWNIKGLLCVRAMALKKGVDHSCVRAEHLFCLCVCVSDG